MKEMIQARKQQMHKRGKKGFTLMEMLIVVAIIAILIAIAIPVFMAQLENARDATSVANLRSAYAEASAAELTGTNGGNSSITVNGNVVTVSNVKLESSDDNLGSQANELPFTITKATNSDFKAGNKTCTFTFNTNGTVACEVANRS